MFNLENQQDQEPLKAYSLTKQLSARSTIFQLRANSKLQQNTQEIKNFFLYSTIRPEEKLWFRLKSQKTNQQQQNENSNLKLFIEMNQHKLKNYSLNTSNLKLSQTATQTTRLKQPLTTYKADNQISLNEIKSPNNQSQQIKKQNQSQNTEATSKELCALHHYEQPTQSKINKLRKLSQEIINEDQNQNKIKSNNEQGLNLKQFILRKTVLQNQLSRKSQVSSQQKIQLPQNQAEPLISSKSWIIKELSLNKILQNKQCYFQREIASLTKLMTLLTALDLIEEYSISKNLLIKVSQYACQVGGTTAQLKHIDSIKVEDVMFGMMLPSGNDASVTLAQNLGLIAILSQDEIKLDLAKSLQNININKRGNEGMKQFLQLMNEKAQNLGMINSIFINVHGLREWRASKSTAVDISICAEEVLRNQQAKAIVSTKNYTANVIQGYYSNNQWSIRQWQNQKNYLKKYKQAAMIRVGRRKNRIYRYSWALFSRFIEVPIASVQCFFDELKVDFFFQIIQFCQ